MRVTLSRFETCLSASLERSGASLARSGCTSVRSASQRIDSVRHYSTRVRQKRIADRVNTSPRAPSYCHEQASGPDSAQGVRSSPRERRWYGSDFLRGSREASSASRARGVAMIRTLRNALSAPPVRLVCALLPKDSFGSHVEVSKREEDQAVRTVERAVISAKFAGLLGPEFLDWE